MQVISSDDSRARRRSMRPAAVPGIPMCIGFRSFHIVQICCSFLTQTIPETYKFQDVRVFLPYGNHVKFRRATSERIRRAGFHLGVPRKQNGGECRARWKRSVPKSTRGRKGI